MTFRPKHGASTRLPIGSQISPSEFCNASDAAPIAYVELVDRDVPAKGQDSGPVQNADEFAEA